MKRLVAVRRQAQAHWVGDGFPVRTLVSPQGDPAESSPFLLLDYAGPFEFSPSNQPRGVGVHPHRGFETVTVVFQGELEHRDSAGNAGVIGPGDVQWMTAGSGVLHEEWHEQAFAQKGGVLEAIQLWVNLPARSKMSKPKYQEILRGTIPVVDLESGGSVRVIAGEYIEQSQSVTGPAKTFTPVSILDIHLPPDARWHFEAPSGQTTMVLVRSGSVRVNAEQTVGAAELAVFERANTGLEVVSENETRFVVLTGQPIDEPVVSHGPFVMNTREEIHQAMEDFRAGRFG